jgi:hypothetical protein
MKVSAVICRNECSDVWLCGCVKVVLALVNVNHPYLNRLPARLHVHKYEYLMSASQTHLVDRMTYKIR